MLESWHMEGGITIHLAAERVFTFFGVPITSTLLSTWLAILILAVIAVLVGRSLHMVPGRIQGMFEALINGVLTFMEEVFESKLLARKFFPLIMTIFLFIFVANIINLLPGMESIGLFRGDGENKEFIPFFEPANSDLNMTLALTLIVFFVIEISGVVMLGVFKYAGKFINFSSPINFLVGIIELFSELARLISFSFRLFGNIFAGKVLLLVVLFFVPYIVPVPFMLFEAFVGVIQAAIFALLTLFFIKIAISEPH